MKVGSLSIYLIVVCSLVVTNVEQMIYVCVYVLVDVKMDQKSFLKIGRYKRSKFSSYVVYDP